MFRLVMELGVTVFVVAILIIAIWVVVEMKRMRHKILAIFLIGLVLFSYLSFLSGSSCFLCVTKK